MKVFSIIFRAYKKFVEIDPMGFDEYEYRKGNVSFLLVAENLKELAVSEIYYIFRCFFSYSKIRSGIACVRCSAPMKMGSWTLTTFLTWSL